MSKVLKIGLILAILFVGAYLIFKEKIGSVDIPKSEDIKIGDSKNLDEKYVSILSALTLLPGFSIHVYAEDIEGARDMIMAPGGSMLVSQTSEGKIVSLQDEDNNGFAETVTTVLDGLNKPHGLAFDCRTEGKCMLYVVQADELSRYTWEGGKALNHEKLLEIEYKSTDRHSTRSLEFLPFPNDSTLLISIGSSCDVCDEGDAMYGKILNYNVETQVLETYATGLRNAVFMTLNPVDGKVFATEMGRDGLGDDLPPDEINIIEKGKNYGWPICYGSKIHDSDFDKVQYIRDPCEDTTAPLIKLQAHSAPLGLSFIQEEGWPEEYWYNLLMSYHGSWNRSEPTGYKVVRMKMNAKGEYLGTEDFISGWLTKGGTKLGRPADVMAMPGGMVYISDDDAGIIYRVNRN